MKAIAILLISCTTITASYSQVERIKSESRKNSDKFSDNAKESAGLFALDLFFSTLSDDNGAPPNPRPKIHSLELMFQGGIQTSNYFMLWPRIRASAGFLATDFRMSYLIEDNIEGQKHIRTNDWQIIQYNLISRHHATFRIGTGIMHEAFEQQEVFNEWTFILGIHSPDQTRMGLFEYRVALDWETEAIPRREYNAQYQHKIFSLGPMAGNLSLGLTFQRYYSDVNVWAVQAGLVFRFLKIVERKQP